MRTASGHNAAGNAADEAFTRYVVSELEVLFRVALSITHDAADAEDLVQETLLRAYRSIERFDGAHPRAWLLTIMRNAHLNGLRRRRPELLRDPDSHTEQIADPAGHAASAESIVMDGTFDSVVESAFNDLPERFRKVVWLVDIGGLSYEEAARAVGIPVGTVMSRLHRGRRRIREQLDKARLIPGKRR
jgi:RNA polymerase sigma-70 factor (ECF subfamily)